MTSEEEAFLTAICTYPADDTPRLVYADYLEEHDQPERARFIRVQCELASLDERHPDWSQLYREETALRKRHEAEWSIPNLRGVQHFHRGFVEVLQTSAEWLLACPKSAFRLVPLRELRLVNMDRLISSVVNWELLDRVEVLTLNNNSLGSRSRLELLLTTRPLTNLKRLELRNCLIWPDTVFNLANSSQASRLHTLDLSGNPIGDAGIAHLCSSKLGQLRSLIIRGDELDARDCLHHISAEHLADSKSVLKQLQHLDWTDQYIGNRGLVALAESSNFQQLERLLLSFNEIFLDETHQKVFTSPHWSSLRLADFSGNGIVGPAARVMVNWPGFARGGTLVVQDCIPDLESHELLTRHASSHLLYSHNIPF